MEREPIARSGRAGRRRRERRPVPGVSAASRPPAGRVQRVSGASGSAGARARHDSDHHRRRLLARRWKRDCPGVGSGAPPAGVHPHSRPDRTRRSARNSRRSRRPCAPGWRHRPPHLHPPPRTASRTRPARQARQPRRVVGGTARTRWCDGSSFASSVGSRPAIPAGMLSSECTNAARPSTRWRSADRCRADARQTALRRGFLRFRTSR